MNRNKTLKNTVIAAMLCAISIIIPMFSPVKIILEPASFTLASHVAIFIAMFISVPVALGVDIGATVGFFLGGFPPVVVMRALSQCIFATIGAFVLSKRPEILKIPSLNYGFALIISIIHALCEVAVSAWYYFSGALSIANYESGFFTAIILLVGVGTFIHSLIDYFIAFLVWKPLSKIV